MARAVAGVLTLAWAVALGVLVCSLVRPPVYAEASTLVREALRFEQLGVSMDPMRLQVYDHTCELFTRVDGVEHPVQWLTGSYLAFEVPIPPAYRHVEIGCRDEAVARLSFTEIHTTDGCEPVHILAQPPAWNMQGKVPRCVPYTLTFWHNQTQPMYVVSPDFHEQQLKPAVRLRWTPSAWNSSDAVQGRVLFIPQQADCQSQEAEFTYSPGCSPRPVADVVTAAEPFRLHFVPQPQSAYWVAGCWALVYGVYLMGWVSHYYRQFPRFLVLTTALMLILQVPLSQHTDFTLYLLGSSLAFVVPLLYVAVQAASALSRGKGEFVLPAKHELYGVANLGLFAILHTLVSVILVTVGK